MKNRKRFFHITLLFFTVIYSCFSWMEPTWVIAANLADDFSGISLNNVFYKPPSSASYTEDEILTITSGTNDKGAIWSNDEYKINLKEDFELTMNMYFGFQGESAKDGMAFVMHGNDDKTIGSHQDASLGVWKTSNSFAGIANSFAIEFDTYVDHGPGKLDASLTENSPHIAWNFPGNTDAYNNDGSLNHEDIQYVSNLSDDSWHKFTVKWDTTREILTYQFEDYDEVTVHIDVDKVFGTDEVTWGFTGSTSNEERVKYQVKFDEIPSVINATMNETITKGDEIVTEDTFIIPGDVLTYTITENYISGNETWEDVTLKTKINEYVEYIPGTLTITDEENERELDDGCWDNHALTLSIGNLDTKTRNEVTVSFQVKVQEVDEATIVSEYSTCTGTNLKKSTESISYTITPIQEIEDPQAPEVTIENPTDDEAITLVDNQSLTITGTWSDKDSDTVSLSYALNEGDSKDIAVDIENTNKGTAVNYEFDIQADNLSIEENTVTVYVVDNTGLAAKATVTFYITDITSGTIMLHVPEIVSFETTAISSTITYAHRMDDWDITVEDSRTEKTAWKVQAQLSKEFYDEVNDHYLKDALVFKKDVDGEDILIGDENVTVFEYAEGNEEVAIAWDEDAGILLKINPSSYAGDYSGEITWTLVDAP